MKNHENAVNTGVQDLRSRIFLPVRNVLCSERVLRAENLRENTVFQSCGSVHDERIIFSPGAWVLLDFGRELNGGVAIVSSEDTGRIRLRFGESATEACARPDQDHAIHDTVLRLPRTGTLEFGNTGFRFVRIDAMDAVEVLNVYAVALERFPKEIGQFESSDKTLNAIWRTGRETVRLCMQQFLVDGIKRDRMVWCGDMNPEIAAVLVAYGPLEIIPESLKYAAKSFTQNGFLQGMPAWELWWLVSLYDYFSAAGDTKILNCFHERICALVERLAESIASDGSEKLPEYRYTCWEDEANESARHAGLHGLLAYALFVAERLAVFLHDSDLADSCSAMRSQLLKHVPEPTSPMGAAMLALSGIRPFSLPSGPTSVFPAYYALQMMNSLPAMETVRRIWGGMLTYGGTTFHEEFDPVWLKNACKIDEFPENGRIDFHAAYGNYCYQGYRRSLCHGWASGVTAFLSRRISGLRALTPGYETFKVKPDFCGLKNFFIRIPVSGGTIEVEGEKGKYTFRRF